jgi:hypothetical protein
MIHSARSTCRATEHRALVDDLLDDADGRDEDERPSECVFRTPPITDSGVARSAIPEGSITRE